MDFVAGAGRGNPLTSRASVAELEKEIKVWLRGAPDRNGGRAKRAKAKARCRAHFSTMSRSDHQRSQSPALLSVLPKVIPVVAMAVGLTIINAVQVASRRSHQATTEPDDNAQFLLVLVVPDDNAHAQVSNGSLV